MALPGFEKVQVNGLCHLKGEECSVHVFTHAFMESSAAELALTNWDESFNVTRIVENSLLHFSVSIIYLTKLQTEYTSAVRPYRLLHVFLHWKSECCLQTPTSLTAFSPDPLLPVPREQVELCHKLDSVSTE